jgi:hypothetical protein
VNTPLLAQLDFVIGTGFTTLNSVVEGMPGVTAAAFFQKTRKRLSLIPIRALRLWRM